MIRTTNNGLKIPHGSAHDSVHGVRNVSMTQFIVFDNQVPIYVSCNGDDARMRIEQLFSLKIQRGENPYLSELHALTHDPMTGDCIEHVVYMLDNYRQCYVVRRTLHQPLQQPLYYPVQYFPQRVNRINACSIDRNVPNCTTYLPLSSDMSHQQNTISQHQYHNNQITDHSVVNQSIPPLSQTKDVLENELIKLSQLLTKVGEKDTTKNVVDELENIYENVQEEAMLSAEIKSTKNKLDKTCKERKKRAKGVYNDITDVVDETVFSDDDKEDADTDTDTQERSHDDSDFDNTSEDSDKTHESDDSDENSSTEGKLSSTEAYLQSNPADALDKLIKARNALQKEVDKQETIVNKANEKLNEDLFVKRCEDQKKRKDEQKYNEQLSIFASDKNTYLVMQSKVNRGILKESNVSPFFNHKYHIIKFMEKESLISLRSNQDVDTEHYVFSQLQKVIDGYDYEPDIDENNENTKQKDPMDDIDETYLPLCEKFLEILENAEHPIIGEKKVHDILNNNPELKKAIFKDTADQTVFDRDISKEEYEEMEKQAKQEEQNNKHN